MGGKEPNYPEEWLRHAPDAIRRAVYAAHEWHQLHQGVIYLAHPDSARRLRERDDATAELHDAVEALNRQGGVTSEASRPREPQRTSG